jgi:hypothetical protein
MKILSLPRVLFAFIALALVAGLHAQAPATKATTAPVADPAAEAAFDAFFKVRDQKDVAPTSARFNQMIKAGLPLLVKYPKHRRAPEVIRRLTDVASGFNDKATVLLRDVWFSTLRLELLNVPADPLDDDDGRAALLALSAANANAEARLSREKETVEKTREKIDELAVAPGGKRFLADQEMGFIEVIKTRNPDAAEKLAQADGTSRPGPGRAGG